MKLLVTGASGLLGRKLVELASGAGHNVYPVYNTHPLASSNTRQLDICDETAVNKLITETEPDAVMHAASITDVDLCERDPGLAMRVNATATGFVAKACRSTQSYMVYISTDYIFDGTRGRYREEDKPSPINAYGRSKLLGERQVSEHSTSCCIARTSVLYGWGRMYRPNFASWIFDKLRTNEAMNVIVDQFVSPTLNSSLAAMLLEVADRRVEGIMHLAGATRISRWEFALRLARTFGLNEKLLIPARSESMRWKARRPSDSSLDVSKALETLNNKPAPIDEALKQFAREAPKP